MQAPRSGPASDAAPPVAGLDTAALLRSASTRPGVYLMRGEADEVLYVGKARNLRLRLRGYFTAGRRRHPPKVRALLARVRSVETLLTAGEGEALVLESNLIKRHRPRYNHLFRDDKSYPYIHLTAGHDYPRLRFHRGARRGDGRYFGPYPDAHAVRATLGLVQKLFRIRDCSDSMFQNRTRPCLQHQIDRCSAPCVGLTGQAEYAADLRRAVLFLEGRNEQVIEELTAPMRAASAALDYERAARCRDLIVRLRAVQERHQPSEPGRDADLVACCVEGERACVTVFMVRNGMHLGGRAFFPRHLGVGGEEEVISAFLAQHYLERGGERVPPEIRVSHLPPDRASLARVLGERLGRRVLLGRARCGLPARLLQLAMENAEYKLRLRCDPERDWEQRWTGLAQALEFPEIPQRIECFDVSHTAGEAVTASCVVFSSAGALNGEYRRYNIKGVRAGDDCAALRQAVLRRYRRTAGKAPDPAVPSLILVDGGAHQVRAVRAALCELPGELPAATRVAGLAKGPGRRPAADRLLAGEPLRPLRLAPGAAPLLLLQRIRDEAHRFAVAGHRRRRAGERRVSLLERVEGVGRTRRRHLLQHFGGLQGVSRAGVEELARVPGIHLRLAHRIHDLLHPGPRS